MKRKHVIAGYVGYNYDCKMSMLFYCGSGGETLHKGWTGYFNEAVDISQYTESEQMTLLEEINATYLNFECFELKYIYCGSLE